jgi:hypothetical protein
MAAMLSLGTHLPLAMEPLRILALVAMHLGGL